MGPRLASLPALDFSGQTALVTGTTNGLGLATCEELLRAHLGTLIMGVRDVQRGEALKTRLLAQPGNKSATMHVLDLQMEDYKSVATFSTQVKELVRALDIVVLNAGTGSLRFEIGSSGHEKMIQVNLLSNALLALELLPLLSETAKSKGTPSRLTWVGSFVQADHSFTKSPIPDSEGILQFLDDEKKFKSMARYSDSKLLTTMFVDELARRIDRNKVIFNEVTPGPVNTNFGANYPALLAAMFKLLLVFKARSVSEAVKTYFYAFAVAGKESHGKYLSDNKIAA